MVEKVADFLVHLGDTADKSPTYAVVSCAIVACNALQLLCNNCRLSNVMETIHEAKMLQPMTEFGGIT